MKYFIGLFVLSSVVTLGFHADSYSYSKSKQPQSSVIETRFDVPEGFKREVLAPNSFAMYLRNLPLKPVDSEVKIFNGNTKKNLNVYDAVVNLPIGNKNLHQCADAVMRLRAEYLWKQKQYHKIHFNFTNGFRVNYSEWMKGRRIIVKGNKTSWSGEGVHSNTYADFWNYMETIFMYAGTLSLSKELVKVAFEDLKIGDVFIIGGSPGHAILVVDLAIQVKTKEKMMILAQSYMPAQELQILRNQLDRKNSPWYSTNFAGDLETPEWTFSKSDLMRFVEE